MRKKGNKVKSEKKKKCDGKENEESSIKLFAWPKVIRGLTRFWNFIILQSLIAIPVMFFPAFKRCFPDKEQKNECI